MSRLLSPDGKRIIGVIQDGTGVSYIEEDNTVLDPETGLYDLEWSGTSEWLEQGDHINENTLERVFMDEEFNEWDESQLQLVDD